MELARADRAVQPPNDIESVLPEKKPTVLPVSSGRYMQTFGRITGIAAVCFLVAGLVVWKFHPWAHNSQGRMALLILVCAMFLSILHYYSLEDTGNGRKPGVKL